MPVWVEQEGGVIVWTVVGSQPWTTVVSTPVSKRCFVKVGDGLPVRRGERKMKARSRRTLPFRPKFDGKLIASALRP